MATIRTNVPGQSARGGKASIDGYTCKGLPARTQAAMNKGMPQRKALATTTSPRASLPQGMR
jgi:hypothetical protein